MSAAAVSPAREDSAGPAATKPSRRRTHTIVVGLTVLAAALALRYSASMPARVDEPYHVKQIEVFYRGDCRMYVPPGSVYPFLAMLPGYHAVVAAIARLLEVRTFSELRLIHFGLSLLLLPAAYFTARSALGREQAWLRALQCFCCPPIFALCFVVYTDVFALTVPLASLACCLGGRFTAGGLLGLAGLLVRQTNVVLLALTPPVTYFRTEPSARPSPGQFLTRCWAFGLAGLFLFGFLLANGGRLPLCSPKFQSVGFFCLNVALSAALGALLFIPWLTFAAPRTTAWIKAAPWPALTLTAAALTTALFAQVTEDRNRLDLWPELLRNQVLHYATAGLAARFALGLAAAAMLLTVAAAGFDRATLAFLALTWLGTTLPLALVEPRYYLPTFALLVLLRPPASARQELTQWAYFLTLGLALHAIHVHGRYFL